MISSYEKIVSIVSWFNGDNRFINKIVKLVTIVEDYPRVPLSLATTPRCIGEVTLFLGLLHFTIDPYPIMLSIKWGGIMYHFWVFGMIQPGIKPRSPVPSVKNLPAGAMNRYDIVL